MRQAFTFYEKHESFHFFCWLHTRLIGYTKPSACMMGCSVYCVDYFWREGIRERRQD